MQKGRWHCTLFVFTRLVIYERTHEEAETGVELEIVKSVSPFL